MIRCDNRLPARWLDRQKCIVTTMYSNFLFASITLIKKKLLTKSKFCVKKYVYQVSLRLLESSGPYAGTDRYPDRPTPDKSKSSLCYRSSLGTPTKRMHTVSEPSKVHFSLVNNWWSANIVSSHIVEGHRRESLTRKMGHNKQH